MSKYHYRNDTENDLVVVGVGVVEAGKTIASDELIENPNLTPVKVKKKAVNKESGDDE